MFDWNPYVTIENINELYESLGTHPIRVLTFQTPHVLETILKNKTYYADGTKTREKRSYISDINQLGGYQPIWCFSPLVFHNNLNFSFTKDEFINGELFCSFRCEMSLGTAGLNNFDLLELEVPANTIKRGLTHNAFIATSVIPKIDFDNLVGIYKLHYDEDDDVRWYYPDVTITSLLKPNPLFTENFTCKKNKSITLL